MARPSLASQPPELSFYELSFPAEHVLQVTISRESHMNAIPMAGHWQGERLWQWFDEEPQLRVAIVTGKGRRAFCCGADLKEQAQKADSLEKPDSPSFPAGGFMGLTRRVGKKPVIAAVNGFALGGGFEVALNCDMVVASPSATFGLPEAKRGLWAAAGGIPRAVRTFGMQMASEIVLAGRVLSANEAKDLGFCRVAASADTLVDEAVALAKDVASMSPDAVIVSRAGLRETWETASVERAAQLVQDRYATRLLGGENLRLGLMAFVTKTKPEFVPSKL
ncbi:Crotonase, core [Metarhizium album ARSEF 1941]|uniref:Crotonase, core n=1 Tax=Metarhizium album (strain ARSEF 1941) TaxID=1081103 RepID=A0A0B2WXQ6_METAS|nr:Crotonase, core [Metarhizium album ARSEF 1941]KHN98359.1 Crotonase, core [Metarhizium album ARSEF 1941]